MDNPTVKVGVIGCGNISGIYLDNGAKFSNLEVVACADVMAERAAAKAAQYGIKAYTIDELLADPEIEVALNLTPPAAHGPVALQALAAGKSIYNEKPLAVSLAEAHQLLDNATAAGLRVGGAPDTFLGGGLQTCRKLIDDGAIGKPLGATAFMLGRGPEGWHPDPDFFYQPGGGPLFDMGPYYLTALITLLGPVRRVTASAQISFPERTITSPAKNGQIITVRTPTHIAGVLDFASGAVGTLVTSFDVWGSEAPRMEIYGSEGTLSLPDPNTFGGPVRVRRAGEREWTEMPLTHGYAANSRGIGVADMAFALRNGGNHRASGALAYHVLDIMHGFLSASEQGKHLDLTSGVERPAALPLGLTDWDMSDYSL